MAAVSDIVLLPDARSDSAFAAGAWAFGPSAVSSRHGPGRRVAFAAIVLIFEAVVGVALLGYHSLATGWFVDGAESVHRMHLIGWGAFAGVILGGGALAQLRAPARNVASMQQLILCLGVGGVSILVSGAVGPSHVIPGAAAAIPVVALVALHPSRGRLLRPGRISPLLAVLSLMAAGPLLYYAYVQASIQRVDHVTAHGVEFHWGTMTTLALAVAVVGLMSCLRTPGWRISAWSAGVAAAVVGVASMLFPASASSLGRPWGIATVVMAAAFVGAAEREARRARRSAANSAEGRARVPAGA